MQHLDGLGSTPNFGQILGSGHLRHLCLFPASHGYHQSCMVLVVGRILGDALASNFSRW